MTASTCGIFAIPAMCEASTIINSAGGIPIYQTTITESGVIIASGGAMALGKLRSNIPSYDPSNDVLDSYAFTAADVTKVWQPTVYVVSGGAATLVSSGGITTTGQTQPVCTVSGGYATDKDVYTLVSWYTAAMAPQPQND